ALGLLEASRRLGVKVVQVGPNLPLDKLDAGELDAFCARARDWDIELELGTRGLEFDHLQRQIALAKRIGATLLRTLPELAGQGQLDIPWLLEICRGSRYDYNVILELWPPEQKTLQQTIDLEQAWADESVKFMRRHIAE